MATKSTPRERPSGLTRLFFKLPVWLYRLNLGWLLGGRFLLLNHVGRTSGRQYETVLEVVRHDDETDTYIVASAWGSESDWFKNVQADPDVEIVVGRRHIDAAATLLSQERTEQELRRYVDEHPGTAKMLARFLGHRVDSPGDAYDALLAQVILVAFRPQRAVT